MRIIALAFCLVACFSINLKSVEAQKEVLSSFCRLSLSAELKQSNTSFTEGFRFKVDRNGKPFDIKRVSGKFVDEEEVKSCLEKWKLSGFAENSLFSVFFAWKHGIGWIHMKILSKDLSQVVVNGSKACPDTQ